MRLFYTIIAIAFCGALTKAMNVYTRFLLRIEEDNFFQKLLIFVLMLWLTITFMQTAREALVPGRVHKTVLSGRSPNIDMWSWDTGRRKRTGCLGTLGSLIATLAMWLVLTHLITWSSPTLLFRPPTGQSGQLVLFWHWWSSLFLDLPTYLVFLYYLFRPFERVRDHL